MSQGWEKTRANRNRMDPVGCGGCGFREFVAPFPPRAAALDSARFVRHQSIPRFVCQANLPATCRGAVIRSCTRLSAFHSLWTSRPVSHTQNLHVGACVPPHSRRSIPRPTPRSLVRSWNYLEETSPCSTFTRFSTVPCAEIPLTAPRGRNPPRLRTARSTRKSPNPAAAAPSPPKLPRSTPATTA
jgi:hypothetical protein